MGKMKVWGVCTDNEANIKKARELVHAEFLHIQMYGLLAHTLHLLFTDIMKKNLMMPYKRNAPI